MTGQSSATTSQAPTNNVKVLVADTKPKREVAPEVAAMAYPQAINFRWT